MVADSPAVSPGTPPTHAHTPDAGDAARWAELLDGLDVEALTDRFIERIQLVPGYDPPPIPLAEIRRTGRSSFEALIRGLRDGADLPEDRVGVATDVGVSRARAGVPVESLMTAVRLDFSILWSALTALAGPDDAGLLVRHTALVWQIVDSYAAQTQHAYAAESTRMHDEATSVRQGLVAALFQDAPPPSARLALIAADLGVPARGPFAVAVALGEEVPALRLAVAAAARDGGEIFTHHLGEGLVAFWLPDERAGSALAEAESQIGGLRVGLVEGVVGLELVGEHAGIAAELAGVLTEAEAGAMTWARGWARIAQIRLSDAGHSVLGDVEDALEACGEVERDRLTQAALAYLGTGNVSEASALLFCHRNTLMNRLRRFEEVTGLDVTMPEDAARLVVGWA